MRRIKLRHGGKNPSLPTFKAVLEISPQKPLSVADIRARVRVIDAIEEADEQNDTLVLEDAEHQTLKRAVEDFPWQQASRELLELIDDVLEAKPVSTASLHAVDEERYDDEPQKAAR